MNTPSQQPHAPATGGAVAPMVGVLGVTAMGSLSTGIVTNGVFFIANSQFDYSQGEQWKTGLLGLVMGVTYIPAAFFAHAILDSFARMHISARACLLGVLILMAALCAVPWLYYTSGKSQQHEWVLFAFVGAFNILLGILWPTIETYLTGGRTKIQIRRAAGMFNLTWALLLIAGLWIIAPSIEQRPLAAFWIVGIGTLLAIPFAIMLPKNPAHGLAHNSNTSAGSASHVTLAPTDVPLHAHDTIKERKLLVVFRFQLMASYIVLSAISTILPFVLDRLHVHKNWHTPAESIIATTRLVPFLLMGVWAGWHSRWSTAWVAAAMLLGGFILSVLSPELTLLGVTSTQAVIVLVFGMSLLGFGMGAIYTAAIVYAMEVGSAKIEAAGKHEALIGCGITIGPACVLFASVAEHMFATAEEQLNNQMEGPMKTAADSAAHAPTSGVFVWTVISLVTLMTAGLLVLGLRSARKNTQHDLDGPPLHAG